MLLNIIFMKRVLFYFSLLLMITLADTSCKDECKDVICNNGSCDEGNCVCNYGWSGENCDFKSVSEFYGDWTGDFNCGLTDQVITMHIEGIGNSLDILKMHTVDSNIDIQGFPISLDSYILNAIVDSTFTSFVIDPFEISIPLGTFEVEIDVQGSGKLLENKNLDLILNLKGKSFPVAFECTGELTNQ